MAVYLADLAFTLYGFKTGLLVEANPLMHMVLNYGLTAAIILKLGLLAVFIVAVSLCFRVNLRLAVWAVGVASGVYGTVVLWHVINLVYSRAIWLL